MNRFFSAIGFAAIILFFFLPFLDVRCNDASLKQLSGFELATGTTISMGNISKMNKDESKSFNLDAGDQRINLNYFAIVALSLAIAGMILSMLLIENREITTGLVAFAGLLCLLLLRININHSLEKESGGYGKYVISLQYLYGYWLAVIGFAVNGGYNLLKHVDQRQKELRTSEKEYPSDNES